MLRSLAGQVVVIVVCERASQRERETIAPLFLGIAALVNCVNLHTEAMHLHLMATRSANWATAAAG